MEKEKFDIIHHHNISLLGIDLIRKLGPYKNLYTAHDPSLVCNKLTLKCKICNQMHLFPQLFRFNAKDELDMVIAPSEFISEVFKQDGYQNITKIPNFIQKVCYNWTC